MTPFKRLLPFAAPALLVGLALAVVASTPHHAHAPATYGFTQPGGFVTPTAGPTSPAAGGGGAGTVTSVSVTAGGSVTNPTGAAAITIDPAYWQRVLTGGAVANKAVTDIAQSGAATVAFFVNSATTPIQVVNNVVSLTTTGAKEGYVPTYDGAAWGLGQPNVPYKTDVLYFSEMLNSGNADQGVVWGATGTGAGCATNGASIAAPNHPGIAGCTLGTTSTGRIDALSGSGTTGTSTLVFSGGQWVYEAYLGVSALSSGTDGYALQAGFIDVGNSATQVDGCYFEYDERNVAAHNATNLQKWIAVCSNNSSRTAFVMDGSTVCDGAFTSVNAAVAALTLPDTNWAKLKVVVNAAGTQADFYVNDVKSCQITTTASIPTTAARATGFGFMGIKSVGATAVFVDVDWMRVTFNETTPRA